MLIQSLILGMLILLLRREETEYAGLSIVDAYNRRQKGLKLMGLGLLLNGLVLVFSGASIPIDGTILAHLGYNETYLSLEKEQIFVSYLMSEQTKLSFLSDVIHLPPTYPNPHTAGFSALLVGLGLLVHRAFIETSRRVRAPTAKGGCVL